MIPLVAPGAGQGQGTKKCQIKPSAVEIERNRKKPGYDGKIPPKIEEDGLSARQCEKNLQSTTMYDTIEKGSKN